MCRKDPKNSFCQTSHYLVLGKATMSVCIHVVTTTLLQVLDKAQVKRTAAILVALELGDSGLCGIRRVETDHSAPPGSSAGFVLDFRLLYLANGCKQFDQIIVAGGPWKLRMTSELLYQR